MSHEILVCQSPHPDGAAHVKPPAPIAMTLPSQPWTKSTANQFLKEKSDATVTKQDFPAAGGTFEYTLFISFISKDGII